MTEQSSIGVGLIGLGTVGEGVARLLKEQADLYRRRLGASIEIRGVLVRDEAKARKKKVVAPGLVTADADAFFETADMPIVVEVAGGRGVVGDYFRRALNAGKHVVTANKSLLAAEGPGLFALARKNHVSIAFEASCCGGIPVITALQFGLMANRIDAIHGILNGTCNYILTEMTQAGKTYAAALGEAQALGFAEADPTLDVSGQDTAQKLAVLASLAFGAKVSDKQIACEGIDRLDLEDVRFASELGYDVKLLAIAERVRLGEKSAAGKIAGQINPTLSLRVQPCFISEKLPLAQVHGSFNALSVYGHATGQTLYMGRGAGMMPTAGAVVSDILNIASGWYPKAFDSLNLWADRQPAARASSPDDLVSGFYLRINARDVPGVMARVTTILGNAKISLSAVMQHEAAAGKFVPVVITTAQARLGSLRKALKQIEKLPVISGKPVCIRIVDLPSA